MTGSCRQTGPSARGAESSWWRSPALKAHDRLQQAPLRCRVPVAKLRLSSPLLEAKDTCLLSPWPVRCALLRCGSEWFPSSYRNDEYPVLL